MVALAGVDGEYGKVDGCWGDGGTVTETKGFAPSDTITEGAACGCGAIELQVGGVGLCCAVLFIVVLNSCTHARLCCVVVGFGC